MSRSLPAAIGAALVLLAGAAEAQTGARLRDESTVKDDSPSRTDAFVSRAGPGWNAEKAYRAGQLGVLLTSYGREPLFLAYRTLSLDAAALQQQASAPDATGAGDAEPKAVGVPAWLTARNALAAAPLAREIATDKNFPDGGFGSFINCGDPAFDLAAQTLNSLAANRDVAKPELRAWIEAQDAVFAHCGNDPGPSAGLAALPASARPLLKQLREYQIAAQHFYAGRYDQALPAFDRIAAQRAHPMRQWAAHGALRTIVRQASLDTSLIRNLAAIRAAADSDEQKAARIAAARKAEGARRQAAFTELQRRADAILADPSLAAIHAAGKRLVNQAKVTVVPFQLFTEKMAVLARFDRDPVKSGDLELWARLGDRLFDYGGPREIIASLRSNYAFFDWIRTIQGCTDNPRSPNFTGRCADEHAHAVAMWTQARSRPWLVATLLTANEITPTVEQALREADRIAPESSEFLTLRYHAIKLRRLAGQPERARQLLDATLATMKSGQVRAADSSATNLLRQEGFALARNATEALPFVERVGPQPAADVDEWLNRRLSSDDLLALAQQNGVAPNFRNQLLVAAWWRAELAGKAEVAQKAAKAAGEAMPNLQTAARVYLGAADADERAYVMARIAVSFRLSPQVLAASRGFAGKPRPAADYWCSFDSAEHALEAQVQRVPQNAPLLAPPSGDQASELAALAKQGTALEWLARITRSRLQKNPADPQLKNLLTTVARSDQLWCRTTTTDAAVREARETLARLGQK